MTIAGLEFSARVLRYTEVEHTGSGFRLLRLGNCDFEFDAQSDIFSPREPEHIETVRAAVADVFSGTDAEVFRFTLPSNVLTSFPSLVESTSEERVRNERLAFEMGLLGGERRGGDVFPAEGAAVEGKGVRVQVDRAPALVRDRLSSVREGLSSGRVALIPGRTAVVNLARALGLVRSGTVLLVGCGRAGSDYTLFRDAERVRDISQHSPYATDRLYYALDVLDQIDIGVGEIDDVLVYGENATDDTMDALRAGFDSRVRRLDPGPAVEVTPDQFESGFHLEAYSACIGAAVSS